MFSLDLLVFCIVAFGILCLIAYAGLAILFLVRLLLWGILFMFLGIFIYYIVKTIISAVKRHQGQLLYEDMDTKSWIFSTVAAGGMYLLVRTIVLFLLGK